MYNPHIIASMIQHMPHENVEMSIKNCHVDGLHSIVLHKSEFGPLIRMYLCDENHTMWKNYPNEDELNSLGIHDHKYDIVLRNVFGNAYDCQYEIDKNGRDYDKHLFYSKLNGKGGHDKIGQEKLEWIRCLGISKNGHVLKRQALHTVAVPENQTACWIVEEGTTEIQSSTLFTHENQEIKFSEHKRFKNRQELFHLFRDCYMSNLAHEACQSMGINNDMVSK